MKLVYISVLALAFASSIGAQDGLQEFELRTPEKIVLSCGSEPISKDAPWDIKVHGCKIADGFTLDDAVNGFLKSSRYQRDACKRKEQEYRDILTEWCLAPKAKH